MTNRSSRATGAEIALLAALAAWALIPLALVLIHAAQTHSVFTGADGVIGADGVVGADQLQYLAWARDAATHVLASDLFIGAPTGHVFLEPLFTLTGLLTRLGLSLPLAYLLWKPVAIVVLMLAARAWAARLIEGRAAQAAAIALGLFLCTPLAALFSGMQLGSGSFRFGLYVLGDELLLATKLWGYAPSALGAALVPVALLALERSIDPRRVGSPARRALAISDAPGAGILAALAALGASWLHPWQGVTLVVICLGLIVWRRLDGATILLTVAVAAALPLGYYYLLSHGDGAWRLASLHHLAPPMSALVLLAGLGPPVALAALGLRAPGDALAEQALLLWIPAALVTYLANDAFASHALQGLSFPLAVLAVRGGQRIRLPVLAGIATVAIFTLPGLALDAKGFIHLAGGHAVQYYLPRSDARALAFVAKREPGVGVLAPAQFAAVVPSRTGSRVWVGHGYWSRDYPARARQVNRLFAGRMPGPAARRFVTATGAAVLVGDCAHRTDLTRTLRPLLGTVKRFGCARVYVLAAGRTGRSTRR